MPAFSFEALDAQGQTRKGMLEADTAKAARSQLQGARHHAVINSGKTHFFLGAGDTSRMAREKASTSSKLR